MGALLDIVLLNDGHTVRITTTRRMSAPLPLRLCVVMHKGWCFWMMVAVRFSVRLRFSQRAVR